LKKLLCSFFILIGVVTQAQIVDSIKIWKARSASLVKTAPDSAISLLNKGLYQSGIANRPIDEAWFNYQKGVLFIRFSDTAKGVEYLSRSLDYYLKSEDTIALINTLYQLGKAKSDLKLLEKATPLTQKTHLKLLDFKLTIAQALVLTDRDPEHLDEKLSRALYLAPQLHKTTSSLGPDLVKLAQILFETGRTEEALRLIERFQQPAMLKKKYNALLLLQKVSWYTSLESPSKALVLLDSTFNVVNDILTKAKLAKAMASLAEQLDLKEKELTYLEAQDSLRIIFRQSNKENLVHLVESENDDKLKSIRINQLEAQLIRDWYWKGILGVTLIIAFVFTFFIVKQIRKRRKAKRLLLESKKKQEEVSKRLLETQVEHKKFKEGILLHDIESNQLDLDLFSENFAQETERFKLLQSELDRLKRLALKPEQQQQISKMQVSLRQLTQRDFSRKQLLQQKTEIDEEWLYKLQVRFPSLTEQDIELLICISSGMEASEIASLYNIEKQSVMTKRYRLRKKLKLSKEQRFEDFLKLEI
jgi:hypothetical protein